MMEHRSPNRYRFSLAHELGHIVLHQEVLASVSFATAAQWKSAILAMSEAHRERVEFQAYDFAGLLLVPRTQLKEHLAQAIQLATGAGFSLRKESDVAKEYVSTWLGRVFEVSSQAFRSGSIAIACGLHHEKYHMEVSAEGTTYRLPTSRPRPPRPHARHASAARWADL